MSDSVLTLLRDKLVTNGPTMGVLSAPGLTRIQTLELPWKNNQPFVSCIPTGTYEVKLVASGRFGGMMPGIANVYGRTGILFHPAHQQTNIEGCVGTGEVRDTPTTITGQVPAWGRLFAWLDKAWAAGRVLVAISYADGEET